MLFKNQDQHLFDELMVVALASKRKMIYQSRERAVRTEECS